MNNNLEISTSILSIKDNLIDNIIKLNETDTDYIHYDIMDGKFVSNISFSNDDIRRINEYNTKKLDVHLMVENPKEYINFFKAFNPEYITIHYEIDNLEEYINFIKSNNIKVGVSIKPNTKVSDILYLLDRIDLVLIMSVEPGMGGQTFIDNSIDKINELKSYINKNNLDTLIEVDGGINDITSKECKNAGADILVSGSYITNHNDYQLQIDKLR